MIRISSLFLCLSLSAAPAGAAERVYSITDFDRIQVEGPYEVSLVTGRASSAQATGSAEALDRVAIEVQGRTLKIRPNRSAWGGYPGANAGPVRIEAATRDLRAAAVTGSGSLGIDQVRGLRIDLSVSGSGRLAVGGVRADNLVVGLLGSGRIALRGTARQLKATVQGSGDLEATALRADDLQVNSDTAGTIALAASRSANITATGAGNVTVSGSPACTVRNTGSGEVICGRGR